MPSPASKVAVKRSAKPVSAVPKTAPKSMAKMPIPKAATPVANAIGKSAVKKAVVAAKPAKKPKLVRDSFKMPKSEYAVIEELKTRAAKLGQISKKSELLRAGIKALSALPDADLAALLAQIPTLKTGRPKAN